MNLVPLERHTTQTLLGICFWDRLTNHVISEGLQVRAQRLSSDRTRRMSRAVMGRLTPSGTIAFFGLVPEEVPSPGTNQQLWETVLAAQWVVIDLVDRLERFLPLSFVARLPWRGAFRGQGDWLSTSLLRPEPTVNEAIGVQLWSAPTRPIRPGMATIQTQIVVGDGADAPPAAYALVRVQQDSTFDYYGLTDERGTLLLPMPYPAIPDPEPADQSYPPLDQQTFALNLTVYYTASRSPLPGSEVANLETLLRQTQVNIAVRRNPDSTLEFRPNLSVNLRFGHSLILGTALSPSVDRRESVLRIQPT